METTRRRFVGLGGAALVASNQACRDVRRQPNVLWIMTDEQRPDSLGCYRSPWAKTPRLDALAAEGVLFESAYTPSPVCVPARCSLLTGRYGSTLDVLHNRRRLRDDARFLTWRFEEAGYRTASFGKKHYFYSPERQAFQAEAGVEIGDVVDAQSYRSHDPTRYDAVVYPGNRSPEKRTWILGGLFPGKIDETAEARNLALAREWLGSQTGDQPFFLRLSLNAPHTPVVVPREFVGSADRDLIDLPFPSDSEAAGQPAWVGRALADFQGAGPLDRDQIQRARGYYYDRVAFLDQMVGEFLDWMDAGNLLDDTIVAFTSDHGTHLGDHGLFQKQTFYEQVATTPYFFWKRDGFAKGRRVTTPVSTLSLLPTLLEAAGLAPDTDAEADSLATALQNGAGIPEKPVFSELKLGYQGYRDDDRLVMIRCGRRKLFQFLDSRDPRRFEEEPEGALFDLEADPGETANLYDTPVGREVRQELMSAVVAWDRARLGGTRD